MKEMTRTLTFTQFGLCAVCLFLLSLVGAAQEVAPDSRAEQEAYVQSLTAAQRQQLTEALKSVQSSSPVEQQSTKPVVSNEAPGVEQRRTVGEVFERLGSGRDPTSEAVTEVPAGQKLHFSENPPPGPNWATQGQVGRSTFVDHVVRVTWSLALICLLVYASAKIAAKLGLKPASTGLAGGKKNFIEILEKKRLSPGRNIMLMQVGPKVLAVAATESGYETLTEFSTEDFKKYQDNLGSGEENAESSDSVPVGVTTPADIARHYLSILPGTGAKK